MDYFNNFFVKVGRVDHSIQDRMHAASLRESLFPQPNSISEVTTDTFLSLATAEIGMI